MLFEMCESLGFASPRHLLRALRSDEVEEWKAFYRVRAKKQEQMRKEAEHKAKADGLAKNAAQGRL